jgi:alkanesulfonate monooxygenase SsuD/methylene tetrahydromethanopterin reductase-like flavin-dependent oxidoreductase (luciferase family)
MTMSRRCSFEKASYLLASTETSDAVEQILGGAQMSERLETLKKARDRMIEDRDAHAKVLAAPFVRDTAERARNKFVEIQALIDALDSAIKGENLIPVMN